MTAIDQIRRNGELWELDATTLHGMLRSGAVSAREVVLSFLDRIDGVNGLINAIATLVAEGALADADKADRSRASGHRLGLLHGLTIAVKDLVDTARIRTTYGSPIYRDYIPTEDALLVKRLRKAGAIIIGKTNTPEFGAGSQTFNPVFGPTRNPYDVSRTAGGSSGGAAAAVAACLLPFADGSDVGGSLRNPASFCNVIGLRPTPGRVPGSHKRCLGPSDCLWTACTDRWGRGVTSQRHVRSGSGLTLVADRPAVVGAQKGTASSPTRLELGFRRATGSARSDRCSGGRETSSRNSAGT